MFLAVVATLLVSVVSGHWAGPLQTGAPTTTANWSPATTSNAKRSLLHDPRAIYPGYLCGW